MKYSLTLGIAISVGFGQAACAQTVPGDVAVQDQWFTGTLEAPSPALPKADLLVVKPFVIFTRTDGSYDTKGLCCKTDVGDSRRESSGIDGRDAQTCRTCVSHDELA
ncbi:hypothetical protein [Sphingomonas sp. 10B4]|uniref:hypothetical protein n=1 Tax=Sphingomonas sp. 10B4 TaxID=3048575 RepID=UPI002AB36A44|nr:hypothetical protein [Sphingomonas sp. 10B4]MDY7524537.1 hypothetical protein [Sphingomonas sp. 10B4]